MDGPGAGRAKDKSFRHMRKAYQRGDGMLRSASGIALYLTILVHNMQGSIPNDLGKWVLSRTIRSHEKLDVSAPTSEVYRVSVVPKNGQVYGGEFVKG